MSVLPASAAVLSPDVGPGAHQTAASVRLEESHLSSEAVRIGDIVLVLPCDVAPCRQLNSPVQGRRQSAIALRNEPHPGVLASGEHRRRRVCGSIVDDQQLVVTKSLIKDTLDCCGYVIRAVVDRKNDADKWIGHVG